MLALSAITDAARAAGAEAAGAEGAEGGWQGREEAHRQNLRLRHVQRLGQPRQRDRFCQANPWRRADALPEEIEDMETPNNHR